MLSEKISIGGARVSGFALSGFVQVGPGSGVDKASISAPYSDPSTANPMDRVVQQATSKAAVVGIVAGAATVIGGIVYLATRKPRRRRRR